MLSLLTRLLGFRHTDWRYYPASEKMWRWNGRWESREATPAETHDWNAADAW